MSQRQDELRRRVKNSKKAIGHPHNIGMANSDGPNAEQARSQLPVLEGTHYEVLAYSMWADYHTPTVVKWAHGETDDFTNRRESMENQERALEYVEGDDGGA